MLFQKRHVYFQTEKLTPKQRAARTLARQKEMQKRQAEAPLALREYYDAQQAEREKTARLRALRLARGSDKEEA